MEQYVVYELKHAKSPGCPSDTVLSGSLCWISALISFHACIYYTNLDLLMLLAAKWSQYKSEIAPLYIAAISFRPCPPRERNELLSCVLLCGESGEATQWIKPTFLSCKDSHLAAHLQRLIAGAEAHAYGWRRVKPCMQQCYIHTSFGGFPLRCLLSLSPPLALCNVHVFTITPTRCCSRLYSPNIKQVAYLYLYYVYQSGNH